MFIVLTLVICIPFSHYSHLPPPGWPRLLLQVYRQDALSRVDVCGYGIIHIPTRPGHHTLHCHTWRPVGECAHTQTHTHTYMERENQMYS